jgi:hypothetical protein
LNPKFSKPILVDYWFEEIQKLKFEVYDIDNPAKRKEEQDFIGETVLHAVRGLLILRHLHLIQG